MLTLRPWHRSPTRTLFGRLAPAEGTIIPVGTTNGEILATEDAGTWVTDESGWSLQCDFVDAGWDVRMDENAALYVAASGDSAVGQCAGVDAFGAETVEHRNYTFGKVMDASAALSSDGDQINSLLHQPTLFKA